MAEASLFCPTNDTPMPYSLTQRQAWRLMASIAEELEVKHSDYLSGDEMAILSYRSIEQELQMLHVWFTTHCGYDDWQEELFDSLEKWFLVQT